MLYAPKRMCSLSSLRRNEQAMWALAGRILALTVAVIAQPMHAAETGARRPVNENDLITVRSVSNVSLSPDGKWISYVLKESSLQKNQHVHNVFVIPVDRSSPERQLTNNGPTTGQWASMHNLSTVWSPDSKELVYISVRDGSSELRGINIQTGAERTVVSSKELPAGVTFQQNVNFPTESLQYSPDGRRLALIAYHPIKVEARELPHRGIELRADWYPEEDRDPRRPPIGTLYVMDLRTRDIHAVTDATMHVSAIRWSPNGKQLALIANVTPKDPDRYMNDDVYLVDPQSSTPPRQLVNRAGQESRLAWSPDGTSLAFCTQRGIVNWQYQCSLATVNVRSGAIQDIGLGFLKKVGTVRDAQWEPDGRHLVVNARYRLSRHLFKMDATSGRFSPITTTDTNHYSQFSYSANGQSMAFVVEGATTPQDIYISKPDRFDPVRLTQLNPEWKSLQKPSVEIIRWRSPDNRWDIHGLLLKPSNYREDRIYPMLTAIYGGPSMVEQTLNVIHNYPLLALAEQGYIIFLPNSRGRAGFGADFEMAIRDEKSYVLNPLSDVLAGVDHLVGSGIADPERLGVLGYSYGGTLTSYAVTATNRFKAAVYGEGSPEINLFDYYNDTILGLVRDKMGFDHPYSRESLRQAIDQSALHHLDKVKTPVLIEFGMDSGAWKMDRSFYRGLQYYGVPSEFWGLPRTGHGADEPLIKQNSYRRTIAWLNYWIKGEPYYDAGKQKVYDSWLQRRRSQVNSAEVQ